MTDYAELIRALRDHTGWTWHKTLLEAAEAIEELQSIAEHYKGCSDDWYKEACDYKAICEQMKATVIVEAQHTEMYDERDKKTLVEMAKSLPLQITPYNNEKPRWIPVTERLPDFEGAVLCMRKSYIHRGMRHQEIMYVDEKGFCNVDDVYAEPGNITHWMPLPEPPEEET